MPILVHKNGWTGQLVVVGVTPDRSGTYLVEDPISVPPQLDPLEEDGLIEVFSGLKARAEEPARAIVCEYDDIDPRNKEQILRVTGEGLYRKKFYLSSLGDGAVLGQRPIPQPREHEYQVFSFGVIRPEGQYQRERVYNNGRGKEVVGWIPVESQEARGRRKARYLSQNGKERG